MHGSFYFRLVFPQNWSVGQRPYIHIRSLCRLLHDPDVRRKRQSQCDMHGYFLFFGCFTFKTEESSIILTWEGNDKVSVTCMGLFIFGCFCQHWSVGYPTILTWEENEVSVTCMGLFLNFKLLFFKLKCIRPLPLPPILTWEWNNKVYVTCMGVFFYFLLSAVFAKTGDSPTILVSAVTRCTLDRQINCFFTPGGQPVHSALLFAQYATFPCSQGVHCWPRFNITSLYNLSVLRCAKCI